ncbi:MAG TPA: hypothetical protein VFS21_12615 [Roseiflexaceae bacterium]|nr:hypothetical protein [Roseiflexaceae bacterium]
MSRIGHGAASLCACALIALGLLGTATQPTALENPDPAPAPAQPYQIFTLSPPPAAPLIAPEEPLSTQEYPQRWFPDPADSPFGIGDKAALDQPPAAPPPPFLSGDGPYMAGQRVAQTERLDIYVGGSTFSPEQVAALAPQLEQLLRDNERRFGTTLSYRVSLAFYRTAIAPGRGTRGIAYTDRGQASVYYRPDEDIQRAATVAAHELAHHLQAQRYGEMVQRRSDIVLLEGMATWIVGDRWLGLSGALSWKARARQIGDAGVPLRLMGAERYGTNNAYELWASFVDFLVERYGWEQVDALYRSGRGRAAGSSDYQGITGRSFDELAADWRAWLAQ